MKVVQHIFTVVMFAWLVMIASVNWQSVESVWIHLIDSHNLDEGLQMSGVDQLFTVFKRILIERQIAEFKVVRDHLNRDHP